MTESEQRAVIRSGMVDVADLPEEFRALINDMVATARPQSSSA